MTDKKQIRLTIPAWIVKLKKWEKTHIELVAINIRDDDNPLTKDSVFVVKEVQDE